MNIFVLDQNCEKAAEFMINCHVTKMVTESSQMLANAYTNEQLIHAPKTQKDNIRKYGYYNHPCSIWVRESGTNFRWLLSHAKALIKEGLYRGFNLHFCYEFLDWCYENEPLNIKHPYGLTPFAQAMPDIYKTKDTVQAYRSYYICDKRYDNNGKWMMFYTNRDYPEWFPADLVYECEKNKKLTN